MVVAHEGLFLANTADVRAAAAQAKADAAQASANSAQTSANAAQTDATEALGRGVLVAHNSYRVSGAFSPATDTEIVLFGVTFQARAHRVYSGIVGPFEPSCLTGDTVILRLRLTTDGTVPTTASASIRDIIAAPQRADFSGNVVFPFIHHQGAVTETWKLAFTYGTANGSTGARIWGSRRNWFSVYETGPTFPVTPL